MSSWTRHQNGGAGWDPVDGRWYIVVDHHMVGYVQQLAPPGAKGFHAFRVPPGAPVGKYDSTWKTLTKAAEVLATAAAGDVPITDDMVDAALRGHAECTAETGEPDNSEHAYEAMRAALRRAAPLLLESQVLSAAQTTGVPRLTHEIRAKIEHAWSTATTPETAIRHLVALGVFAIEEWVLDAMKGTVPDEAP
jgi:hypothetical protein